MALVMDYKRYTDMEREKVIALGVVFLESSFVAHSEHLNRLIEWYKEILYRIESNLNGRVTLLHDSCHSTIHAAYNVFWLCSCDAIEPPGLVKRNLSIPV